MSRLPLPTPFLISCSYLFFLAKELDIGEEKNDDDMMSEGRGGRNYLPEEKESPVGWSGLSSFFSPSRFFHCVIFV